MFVNNSSIGLYPEIVRDREQQQRRLGRGKWPALAWATLDGAAALFVSQCHACASAAPNALRKTPFVFVGNNEYRMEGFSIGERVGGLDDGLLSVYLTQRPGRLRLLMLALRALVGPARARRATSRPCSRPILVIESRHRTLRVATDGEITEMQTPLRYRSRPASLQVALPAVP